MKTHALPPGMPSFDKMQARVEKKKTEKLWGFQCMKCFNFSCDLQRGNFPFYDKAPKCCGGEFMTPYEIVYNDAIEWVCPDCSWESLYTRQLQTDIEGVYRCRQCDSIMVNK